MLRSHLAILQKQMLLRLEEIRLIHQHSGNKGANVEQIIREFLRSYLPPTLRVGHGEVIDTSGACSGQVDVIVVNEYHPYLNDLQLPSVFFIEGVAVAGEIKSVLTGHELERSLDNSTRFKSLRPEVPIGTSTIENTEDIRRFIERRPYFLFAFESQLTIEAVADKVSSYHSGHGLPVEQQVDAIFLNGRGTIVNFGMGTGSYQCITPEGKSLPGLVVEKGDTQEDVLLFVFLSWLSACIPHYSLPSLPITNYLGNYRVER